MTRRILFVSVVTLVAGAAIALAISLPPRAAPAVAPAFAVSRPVVRGAYHVHSVRSDGTGTLDEIASAAARAGLQFVIVTDHGDGTRPVEPPTYRSGVLVVDGVEISTTDGHYVAVGMPTATYPLGGDATAVIDDVRHFGGFGIVAHPDSPKPALQWRAWDTRFDAIEWLNADSEWRDEFWASLGGMLLVYPFRPVESLGALLDRPRGVLKQWEALLPHRRVVAVAGADAHARLGFRQATDPYEDRVLARIPSYETSFRAFTNHVIVGQPFRGDAAADAEMLMASLRGGHVFTSIDALASLSAFEARAISGNVVASPGAYLDIHGPVTIEASIAARPGTRLALLRDGDPVYETRESTLRIDVGQEPGAYRIEAWLPSRDATTAVPWVMANPFYVGLRERHTAAARRGERPSATTRAAISTEAWSAEASEGSTSRLQPITLPDGTPAVEWHFALAGGARGAQFAALRFPVSGGLANHDRLQLRAESDRPVRVWAQLRTTPSSGARRWGQSFFVHRDLSPIELEFAAFRPLGEGSAARPPLDQIDSLLLVVDTVNSAPGSAGRIAITDLWFAR